MSKFGSLKLWGNFLISLRQTDRKPKSAEQISKETDISVATVYRLLKELKEIKMVEVKYKEKRRYNKGSVRPVNMWGLTKKGIWLAKGFVESGIMDIEGD